MVVVMLALNANPNDILLLQKPEKAAGKASPSASWLDCSATIR